MSAESYLCATNASLAASKMHSWTPAVVWKGSSNSKPFMNVVRSTSKPAALDDLQQALVGSLVYKIEGSCLLVLVLS